jgi:metal-responsive CopG/Arc/MetJ family transcriptional regulator
LKDTLMDNTQEGRADKRGGIIAFQADAELIATADAIAAEEGISRSDVARRALKREVQRNPREATA